MKTKKGPSLAVFTALGALAGITYDVLIGWWGWLLLLPPAPMGLIIGGSLGALTDAAIILTPPTIGALNAMGSAGLSAAASAPVLGIPPVLGLVGPLAGLGGAIPAAIGSAGMAATGVLSGVGAALAGAAAGIPAALSGGSAALF
jgi:hypothetical protein